MNADTHFRVNTPDVTNEVIDGEAVIINLVTGNYYSLDGEGAEIWSLLSSGAPVGAIVDHLTHCYDCDHSTIHDSVLRLISELQNEQLILVSNETGAPVISDPPHTNGNGRRKFRASVLHKFTDMQELLILDPIHEVDAAGWPHKKTS